MWPWSTIAAIRRELDEERARHAYTKQNAENLLSEVKHYKYDNQRLTRECDRLTVAITPEATAAEAEAYKKVIERLTAERDLLQASFDAVRYELMVARRNDSPKDKATGKFVKKATNG